MPKKGGGVKTNPIRGSTPSNAGRPASHKKFSKPARTIQKAQARMDKVNRFGKPGNPMTRLPNS